MFKHDFEFVDGHQSHLGHTAVNNNNNKYENTPQENSSNIKEIFWTDSGKAELTKVPFFVRGKVKSNTEKYALSKGLAEINDETLYDAKAFFS